MPTPIASASAVISASGGGIVRVGPDRYGVTWHVTRIVTAITGTTPASTAELDLYQNVISTGTQLDGSRRPEQDTSDTDVTLISPDVLIGVYSGCTPGTVATLIVWGDITRGQRRGVS